MYTLKTSWRRVARVAAESRRVYVTRPTGHGKLKRPKFTGHHKFMSRTDREALCRALEK